MPIESWPKMTTRRPLSADVGHGGVAPVDQGRRRWRRSSPASGRCRARCRRSGATSRPYWAERPVDGVGEDDARLRAAVAAGDVERRVRRELRQQRDQRQLREGPGVRGRRPGRPRPRPGTAGRRCRPASRRRPARASRRRRPAPPSGSLTVRRRGLGDHLDDVAAALRARPASMRGSLVAKTPMVGTLGQAASRWGRAVSILATPWAEDDRG